MELPLQAFSPLAETTNWISQPGRGQSDPPAHAVDNITDTESQPVSSVQGSCRQPSF